MMVGYVSYYWSARRLLVSTLVAVRLLEKPSMIAKLKVIFGDTIRAFRKLVLEILAVFFVALAILGIASLVDEYRRYTVAPDNGIWRLMMSGVFASVMLISALHTFWKSRKIR